MVGLFLKTSSDAISGLNLSSVQTPHFGEKFHFISKKGKISQQLVFWTSFLHVCFREKRKLIFMNLQSYISPLGFWF